MTDQLRGPLEARLLEVERRCLRIDRGPRGLRRDAVAIWQGLWDDVPGAGHFLPSTAPTPTANSPFSGAVAGCASRRVAGVAVEVVSSQDPTITWTGTTSATGNFAGSIYLAPPPGGGTVPVTIDFTPAGPELAPLSTTVGLTAGATTTFSTPFVLSPAAGYACTNACAVPWPTTVTCTMTGFAAFPMTWDGTSVWVGSNSAGTSFQFNGSFAQVGGGAWTLVSVDCTGETYTFSTSGGATTAVVTP